MNQAGIHMVMPELRRWDVLAGLMQELELKHFVEVGCKEGRTTGHVLKAVPGSTAIAIDPWAVQEKGGDPKRETYEDWDFTKIEEDFWENVGEADDRCEHWRATSLAAAATAEKQQLRYDLVFIDALHDYESVKADIAAWWPLVRAGGVLAGHDFNHRWPGVERAVADHFDLMEVGVAPDSVWFVVKAHE